MSKKRDATTTPVLAGFSDELSLDEQPLSPTQRQRKQRERAIEQLRDYLAYPRWRSEEALWILAGIDPERTIGGPGDWGLAWLPGGLRDTWLKADGSVDQFALEQHVQLELEDVRGFASGASRSPREWIRLAMRHGYQPPWREILATIPEFSDLAEPSLPKNQPSGLEGGERPISESPQSRGGREKRKGEVSYLVEKEISREFRRWKEDPSLWLNKRSFLREMYRLYCDPDASRDQQEYLQSRGAPAVRQRRTVRRIVEKIVDGSKAPFET
jgi:hypothetical protein